MSSSQAASTTATLRALADANRRHLLATLVDHGEPLSLSAVATEVAVAQRGEQIVPSECADRIHTTLHHAHVPILQEAGLVERAGESGHVVRLSDAPVLSDDWFRRLLDDPPSAPDAPPLDRTLEAVAPARRRTTLATLARADGSRAVEDLASQVLDHEAGSPSRDREESPRTVAIGLAHEHLPALADVGLVRYDDGAVEVDARAPLWRAAWVDGSPLADVVRALDPVEPRVERGRR